MIEPLLCACDLMPECMTEKALCNVFLLYSLESLSMYILVLHVFDSHKGKCIFIFSIYRGPVLYFI